jgi:hypothetical protein
VPDPYYSEPNYGEPGDTQSGFDTVFDICERSCRALLDAIVEEHGFAG